MSKQKQPLSGVLTEWNDTRLIRVVSRREDLRGAKVIHERGCDGHHCMCAVTLVLADGRIFG